MVDDCSGELEAHRREAEEATSKTLSKALSIGFLASRVRAGFGPPCSKSSRRKDLLKEPIFALWLIPLPV